jgi:hypothetical protein
MQKKNSLKQDIHNQEICEDSDTKFCECWEHYLHTAKDDDWTEYVSSRKWLHELCSPYKDKCVDCGRKLLRDKNSKMQKRM